MHTNGKTCRSSVNIYIRVHMSSFNLINTLKIMTNFTLSFGRGLILKAEY